MQNIVFAYLFIYAYQQMEQKQIFSLHETCFQVESESIAYSGMKFRRIGP